MNKKQIEDFVDGLYRKGYVQKHEAEELATTVLAKAKNASEKLDARIDHYVRNLVKKEELANVDHIDYLERRLALLEDELDKLLLERDIANMSDNELESFLKEIGVDAKDLYKNRKNKATNQSVHVPSKNELDEQLIDDIINMKDEDLEKLLKEEVPKKSHLGLTVSKNKRSKKSKKKVVKLKKAKKPEKVKTNPKTEIVVKVEGPEDRKNKSEPVVEYVEPKARGKSKRKSALAKIKEELKKVKKEVKAEKKETKKLKRVAATKEDVTKVKKDVAETGKVAKKLKKEAATKEDVTKVKKAVVKKAESTAKKLEETVDKVDRKVERNKEAIKKVKEPKTKKQKKPKSKKGRK